MKVSEIMVRNVKLANPNESIESVANVMEGEDIGSVPVSENGRLIGMVTDRDIVIRAVAKGLGPNTTIRQVMTERVDYCFEDDDIEGAARKMEDLTLRRLPVLNRDKRLVGIIALSNLAEVLGRIQSGDLIEAVAQPH